MNRKRRRALPHHTHHIGPSGWEVSDIVLKQFQMWEQRLFHANLDGIYYLILPTWNQFNVVFSMRNRWGSILEKKKMLGAISLWTAPEFGCLQKVQCKWSWMAVNFCRQEELQCELWATVLKSCHFKIDFSLVISGCLYYIHGTPSGV